MGTARDRRDGGTVSRDVPEEGEAAAEQGLGPFRPVGAMAVALVEQLDGEVVQLCRRIDGDPAAAAA